MTSKVPLIFKPVEEQTYELKGKNKDRNAIVMTNEEIKKTVTEEIKLEIKKNYQLKQDDKKAILFNDKLNEEERKLRTKMEYLKKNKKLYNSLMDDITNAKFKDTLDRLMNGEKAYQISQLDKNKYPFKKSFKEHYFNLNESNEKFEDFKNSKKFFIDDNVIDYASKLTLLAEDIRENKKNTKNK